MNTIDEWKKKDKSAFFGQVCVDFRRLSDTKGKVHFRHPIIISVSGILTS